MKNLPEQERQTELQELAAKSWNLELIISGAAVFLASYLPGTVDGMIIFGQKNTRLRRFGTGVLAYEA